MQTIINYSNTAPGAIIVGMMLPISAYLLCYGITRAVYKIIQFKQKKE